MSPDDDSGLQPRLDAQANVGPPVLLLVPGYTGKEFCGLLGNCTDTQGTKDRYYPQFRPNASPSDAVALPNREHFDMNFLPDEREVNGETLKFKGTGALDYDSDRTAIKCNADAIAAVLRECMEHGQRVTIISHSKGGQDVLHALVELDNESQLRYRGGNEDSGEPLNLDLWSTVSGWVAFTSNHFESGFVVEGTGGCNNPHFTEGENAFGPDLPQNCRLLDPCTTVCNGPSGGSLYSDFPGSGASKLHFLQYDPDTDGPEERQLKRHSRQRVNYMRDHKDTILDLMQCVPTISAYGSYVPGDIYVRVDNQVTLVNNNGLLNRKNRNIYAKAQRVRDPKPGGANDGLVPARAGQLPGKADIRQLPDDPTALRCGVDHLAPALRSPQPFWHPEHRKTVTEQYILDVEGKAGVCTLPTIEVEIDIKPGSGPNSINCNNPNGVIPVAILSTDTFDATTVDHTTVTFEGASETHVDKRTGLARRHEEDVNGDGRMDLVFHFRLGDADLGCSSTEARLEGETFDGQPIFGVDSVRMIDAGNGNRGAGGDGGGNGHGKGGNPDKSNNGNKGGNGNSQGKGNKGGNGKGKGEGQDQ